MYRQQSCSLAHRVIHGCRLLPSAAGAGHQASHSCAGTDNLLHTEMELEGEQQYLNVTVAAPLAFPDKDMLAALSNIQSGHTKGDIIDALTVATDILYRASKLLGSSVLPWLVWRVTDTRLARAVDDNNSLGADNVKKRITLISTFPVPHEELDREFLEVVSGLCMGLQTVKHGGLFGKAWPTQIIIQRESNGVPFLAPAGCKSAELRQFSCAADR